MPIMTQETHKDEKGNRMPLTPKKEQRMDLVEHHKMVNRIMYYKLLSKYGARLLKQRFDLELTIELKEEEREIERERNRLYIW